jgi:hypothetical protein
MPAAKIVGVERLEPLTSKESSLAYEGYQLV